MPISSSSLKGSTPAAIATAAAVAAPLALGTPSVGVATKLAREDHVHQMPSAAQVNAMSLPLAWNASTNVPVLASGTAPVGNNCYKVTVAGTSVLDSNPSWNEGDLLYFDGLAWQRIPLTQSGVTHYTSYTASAPYTVQVTESPAVKTISLPALVPGNRLRIRFMLAASVGANDSGAVNVKLNGVIIASFQTGTFASLNGCEVVCICVGAAAQSTYGYMTASNGGIGSPTGSNVRTTTVNTSTPVDLTFTLTNPTSVSGTRASFIHSVDVELVQP